MTPNRFALGLVIARCFLSAVLFRFVCFPLYGWPVGWKALGCLAASLALVPIFEALLIALVASGVRSLRRTGLVLIAGSAAALLFATLLLIEGSSWWLRAHGPGFVRSSMVVSAITGFSTLAPWIGPGERRALAVLIAAALGLSVLLLRLAPPISRRRAFGLATAAIAAFLLLIASARLLPHRLLEPRVATVSDAIVKSDLLPTVTLLWGGMLFPEPAPPPPAQALAVRSAVPRPDPSAHLPNILIVCIESLHAGEEVRTVDGAPVMPVLSRLAGEGVRFTRAYAAANESAASYGAILTSRDPLKYHVRETYRWNRPPVDRIYDILAPAYTLGFFSSSNENWQDMRAVSWSPLLSRFFDAGSAPPSATFVSEADTGFRDAVRAGTLKNGTVDDALTTAALHQWLGEQRQNSPGKPFLAVATYHASHYPYEQGLRVPRRFTPAELSDAELKECSFYSYPSRLLPRMRNRYWNSLAYIDSLLGGTVEFLRAAGVLDNTAIIVVGDHGELFGENGAVTHAANLYDSVLRVPFVVWGARSIPPGPRDEPVSLLDVGPLVARLASVPDFGAFQGEFPPPGRLRPIFATAQHILFEDSVLAGRWRYTREQDGRYEHLYDVLADPYEQSDAAVRPSAVLDCLRATLADFRRNQLGYYARPELAATRFPPRHALADIPACRTMAAN